MIKFVAVWFLLISDGSLNTVVIPQVDQYECVSKGREATGFTHKTYQCVEGSMPVYYPKNKAP